MKNDYQVMLPWCSTSSAGNSAAHSRRVSSTSTHPMDMTSIMNAVDSNDEADCGQDDLGQSVENNEREHDDLDECFTPITVSCGIKATVSCGVEPDDVNSRMKMRKQKENLGVQEFIPEEMFMLVKITRVGEEKARVVVHTIRDSVNLFQRRPVLPANTRLELLIALPSVLTVEVRNFHSPANIFRLVIKLLLNYYVLCSPNSWKTTSKTRPLIFGWNTRRILERMSLFLTEIIILVMMYVCPDQIIILWCR